jgi:hypothetical protein
VTAPDDIAARIHPFNTLPPKLVAITLPFPSFHFAQSVHHETVSLQGFTPCPDCTPTVRQILWGTAVVLMLSLTVGGSQAVLEATTLRSTAEKIENLTVQPDVTYKKSGASFPSLAAPNPAPKAISLEQERAG